MMCKTWIYNASSARMSCSAKRDRRADGCAHLAVEVVDGPRVAVDCGKHSAVQVRNVVTSALVISAAISIYDAYGKRKCVR